MKKIMLWVIIVLLTMPNIGLANNNPPANCDFSNYITPTVEVSQDANLINISWNKIEHNNLAGYKIVISKEDDTPRYPENGYLHWITDTNTTSYVIDNSTPYNNGDFGSYMSNGEDYYFSVTAIYDCGGTRTSMAGNVFHLTYQNSNDDNNDDDYTYSDFLDVKEANASNLSQGSAKIWWWSPSGSNGSYRYSTSEDNLENMPWLTTGVENNPDITGRYGKSYVILNGLEEGTEYHIEMRKTIDSSTPPSVGKTKTISFTTYEDMSGVDYPVPVLKSASSNEQGILLQWEAIDDPRFIGYKIVASKNNPDPAYPADGYLYYITNQNSTGAIIENNYAYHNGDFGSYFKQGESYYFSITALYDTMTSASAPITTDGNVLEATYNGPIGRDSKPSYDPLVEMKDKAQLLRNNELGDILSELEQLRSRIREQENEIKYLRGLVDDLTVLNQEVRDSLNQFITYGVDQNTELLGEGERAAVIYSYKSAFNKLPETDDELADAIRIANGRWPSKTNASAEHRAQLEFRKIYLRNPNMANPNDNAAVTVMAYGLRQKAENRNLESEKEGIKTFEYVYGRLPESTEDWNIMQAITYSGATR